MKKTSSRTHAKIHGGPSKNLVKSIHALEKRLGWATADGLRRKFKIVTIETTSHRIARAYQVELKSRLDKKSKPGVPAQTA